MSIRKRSAIAAIVLSAAGLVSIIGEEGFTEKAVIPTKNDRPTVGFGSTYKEDGSPVQMGDTITPVQAIKRSLAHIAKDERGLKRCVTGELYQEEYDVLVDFSYQYGVATTCSSSMVRLINTGYPTAACYSYPKYKYSGGYDCSTLVNGKPNKRCWGVYSRNLERQEKCLGASK